MANKYLHELSSISGIDGTNLVPIATTGDPTNLKKMTVSELTTYLESRPCAYDLDDIDNGTTYARVRAENLNAGHVLLSQCNGDLDDIVDGDTYGKVLKSHLTSGRIRISASTDFAAGYNPSEKNKVFRQATAPSGAENRDLWVDTDDDSLYIYTGGGWEEVMGSSSEIHSIDGAMHSSPSPAASEDFVLSAVNDTAGGTDLTWTTKNDGWNKSIGTAAGTIAAGDHNHDSDYMPLSSMTASRVVVTDASGDIASSAINTTELGYLSGVTSSIASHISSTSNPHSVSYSDVGANHQYHTHDGLNSSVVSYGNLSNVPSTFTPSSHSITDLTKHTVSSGSSGDLLQITGTGPYTIGFSSNVPDHNHSNTTGDGGTVPLSTGVTGTLKHENGGLEVDVSSYNGILVMNNGSVPFTIDNDSSNWDDAYDHYNTGEGAHNGHALTPSTVTASDYVKSANPFRHGSNSGSSANVTISGTVLHFSGGLFTGSEPA